MVGVSHQKVRSQESDWRLDKWFKHYYPGLSHGRLCKLLRTGQIRLDGKRAKVSTRLAAGQEVRIPPLDDARSPSPTHRAKVSRTPVFSEQDRRMMQEMVIYQDDSVIVLNKPPGLAVQGGSKTTRHVDGYLDLLKGNKPERPRLVHRLDKDTSGVLVVARTAVAAKKLTEAFRARETKKIYWALVVGRPDMAEGTIKAPLDKEPGSGGERMQVSENGKRAITDFYVMDYALDKASWIAFKPVTGRTHQIRVHATLLGTPIVGDGKYGGKEAFLDGAVSRKLHLHARHLDIRHPDGGTLSVTAELPRHMRESWDMFGFDADDMSDPFAEEV
ncbi:RluA family pseudouridine synthase [Luteithermobacter gelatinilyticus]|uniref:RluA family pseudouridine synthase n=1 Tax=Luteithermobacter gelatinilyticus TaxID=2582913 RepID=UPI001105C3A3|nr:RluA family pseudouridine synthase [Luteithermobacter gelatinilyticus]